MKKILAVVLLFALSLSLCSCFLFEDKDSESSGSGSLLSFVQAETAEHIAARAFFKIKNASQLCIDGMDDIYNIWRFGIYDADDYSSSTIFFAMSLECSFTSSELEKAAEDAGVSASNCVDGSFLADEWQCCLWVLKQAIDNSGTHAEIDGLLSDAKDALKELKDKYPDYENYDTLKEYYTEVSTYAQFFESQECSFNQLTGLITDYETKIKTLCKELEFDYENYADELASTVGSDQNTDLDI